MSLPASNGKTLLITGINGYIASVLGQLVLTKGYSLRGTTRRLASTEPLLKGPYAAYKDRFKIYEVPDMTVSGAFDEAAKGVHGIFHTASPIDFSLDTYEKMVIPAVNGAEILLESALKAGPQLSSVVVTSSVIAVINLTEEPYVFTEKDFASVALNQAIQDKEEGKRTPASILYGASKTASERAVWKFKDNYKPSFSISTINPGVVIGPPVVLASSPEKLNETLRPLFRIFSGTARTIPPRIGSGSFVDVRDVAFMHLWAYENPEKANGERYIACAGYGPGQAVADILREKYKGTEIGDKIAVGSPGEGYVGYKDGKVESVEFPAESMKISGEKATKEMGLKYIPFTQSVVDTAERLKGLV